ncbi:hypothetical protein Slala05_74800 [Streptomyces lavendulae subsp. lavendulae]|nr:hypothetical protein Slala05_74800 [Streptomyces lavendulae subsp. lavendulae]
MGGPGVRLAKSRVVFERADQEGVRVVEEDEAVTRAELGGGLRGGQGPLEAGQGCCSDECSPGGGAGDLLAGSGGVAQAGCGLGCCEGRFDVEFLVPRRSRLP